MSAIADGVADPGAACTAWDCASAATPGPAAAAAGAAAAAAAAAGAACLGGSHASDSTAMSCEMYLS